MDNIIKQATNVIIITYNILSSKYGNNKGFPKNIQEYLYKEYRWEKIKGQLIIWMEKKAIICLQEVCDYFRELIMELCDNLDYSYKFNKYGGKKSGNMGVMTIYPSNYQVLAEFNGKLGQNSSNNRVKRAYNKAIIIKFKLVCDNKSKYNVDSNVVYKYITVGNYHMPCLYKYPIIQKELLISYIKKVKSIASCNKKCSPFVLAGDFNMSDLEDKYTDLIINNELSIPVSYIPSDYSAVCRDGVSFTNGTLTTNVFNNGKYFAGVLDYILISNTLSFVSYEVLYTCDDNDDGIPINPDNNLPLLPNQYNPSDHIPIITNIDI